MSSKKTEKTIFCYIDCPVCNVKVFIGVYDVYGDLVYYTSNICDHVICTSEDDEFKQYDIDFLNEDFEYRELEIKNQGLEFFGILFKKT